MLPNGPGASRTPCAWDWRWSPPAAPTQASRAAKRADNRDSPRRGRLDPNRQAVLAGQCQDLVAVLGDQAERLLLAVYRDERMAHPGAVFVGSIARQAAELVLEIAGRSARVEETPFDHWQRTIAVNLTGQFLCAREAIRMSFRT